MTTAAECIFLSLLALCLGIVNARTANAEPGALDLTSPTRTVQQMESYTGSYFLPSGNLFKSLLADPKEPRFYLSYLMFKQGSENIHGAVSGYGEIIGLYRHIAVHEGYSWQANFSGGVHAQFDLHAPSLDLVNTDYTIGFPFSFRNGNASLRAALYHQSSHLGDEFLRHNNV